MAKAVFHSFASANEMKTKGNTIKGERLVPFTTLPAGLTMEDCVSTGKWAVMELPLTGKKIYGSYFNGSDTLTGTKYFNFFVGLSDQVIQEITNNPETMYLITTSNYINSEGLSRVIATLQCAVA